MMDAIGVGTVLHGFCNGFFGRDSWDDKIIEGIGPDWVVARNSVGEPCFADFYSRSIMYEYLTEWAKPDQI